MQNTSKLPNIILIMTDQLRQNFLGCTGHLTIQTPNIDGLAEQSILFQNAYCAYPICGPARASLFTGMYPPAHGVLRNHVCVSSKRPLLTDRLSMSDYYCALIGKLHLSPVLGRHGFDYKRHCDSPHGVYDPEEILNNPYRDWIVQELFDSDSAGAERIISESERYPSSDPIFWIGKSWTDDRHHNSTWTGNEAVEFIQGWNKQRPLFLNISFFGPHHPYLTSEPWDSMYDPEAVDIPETLHIDRDDPIFKRIMSKRKQNGERWTEETWKKMIAYYQGAISQIDREVGRVIDALKNADMWDNSLIIFTADHGDELGNFGFVGKGLMTEASSRIPLIIKPPHWRTGGFTSEQCVNSIDLFATCLEVSGQQDWKTEADHMIESRSLVPLFSGGQHTWQNETFVMSGHNPDSAFAMIRMNYLKLVCLFKDSNTRLYELYDMNEKPYDMHNRFNDRRYLADQQTMINKLESWWVIQRQRFPDVSTLKRLSVREFHF